MTLKKINRFYIFLFYFVLFADLTQIQHVFADDCQCENKKQIDKIIIPNQQPETPPVCFNHLDEIKKISADELASRLVFAETTAANCQSLSTQQRIAIFQGIGNVIISRSQHKQFLDQFVVNHRQANETAKDQAIRAAILKPKQFNSSFGQYSCSSLKTLLCPSKNKNFATWWPEIQQTWQQTKQGEEIFKNKKQAYFYYLSEHFDQPTCQKKYPEPAWARTQTPLDFVKNQNLNNCIRFYEKIN